ncbi:Hypothetical predicted protein [Olea europaea subsp. europaea]|uniref:Uncharacterized protein n=1 Tax=Olea europaea subsp. europaea TaxID=158383 RepID=A0A8S0QHK4_OLEEU|nr:Hypothetical predicted protein [Olea europaea subsp. europaea]
MFGTLPDHVRDVSRFSTKRRKHNVQAISGAQVRPKHSGQFLGHGVQDIFGTSHGYVRDARTCSSHGMDGAWFSSILGLFLGMMCRPCPGRVLIAVGISRQFLEHDVQAMLGMRPDCGRQFLGRGVQAMSRMRLGREKKQPDFQAFLGSFWDMVCRPCTGRDRDAT